MKSLFFIAVAALAATSAVAAPLKSAVVTAVVNDVKLSEKSRSARAIGTGQKMGGSSTLLTGRASRAAMTFPDKTVTRVGANSVFSFSSGSRNMEIKQGSFLLQVPKGAGGATIRTATITAGITGTTTMMEYSPGQFMKFICLEGTATLTNTAGDTTDVAAGEMIVMHPSAARFPRPMIVNVKKMMKTSALADKKDFGELDADAQEAIDETVTQQTQAKREGALLPAGLLGRGGAPQDRENSERSVLGEAFGSSN